MEEKKKAAFRQGIIVLIALAILTGIEYVIAISSSNATLTLFIIGLFKAGAIIQYFMHVTELWAEEGH